MSWRTRSTERRNLETTSWRRKSEERETRKKRSLSRNKQLSTDSRMRWTKSEWSKWRKRDKNGSICNWCWVKTISINSNNWRKKKEKDLKILQLRRLTLGCYYSKNKTEHKNLSEGKNELRNLWEEWLILFSSKWIKRLEMKNSKLELLRNRKKFKTDSTTSSCTTSINQTSKEWERNWQDRLSRRSWESKWKRLILMSNPVCGLLIERTMKTRKELLMTRSVKLTMKTDSSLKARCRKEMPLRSREWTIMSIC